VDDCGFGAEDLDYGIRVVAQSAVDGLLRQELRTTQRQVPSWVLARRAGGGTAHRRALARARHVARLNSARRRVRSGGAAPGWQGQRARCVHRTLPLWTILMRAGGRSSARAICLQEAVAVSSGARTHSRMSARLLSARRGRAARLRPRHMGRRAEQHARSAGGRAGYGGGGEHL